MNVLQTHSHIIQDYATYIRSFLNIDDPVILKTVEEELGKGKLWPEPLLQFNPAFEMEGSVADFARAGILHADIAEIFKGYSLYKHQIDSIRLGTEGRDFIVTSGTGSGKSLTYIGTIFHHLLTHPETTAGITAAREGCSHERRRNPPLNPPLSGGKTTSDTNGSGGQTTSGLNW